MSVARPWRAPILIALGVIVLDQLTKHWALNALSAGRIIEVIWTLQFNLAFNSGMAFSRGRGFGPYIAVIATLVIVWLLVSLRSGGTKLGAFGMGCLIGGAAGNLLDRLFRGDAWLHGSVVDFIDFGWFPIFNVADIAVNVGAMALILNSILVNRAEALSDRSENGDQSTNLGHQVHPAVDHNTIDHNTIDHNTEETP